MTPLSGKYTEKYEICVVFTLFVHCDCFKGSRVFLSTVSYYGKWLYFKVFNVIYFFFLSFVRCFHPLAAVNIASRLMR